MPIDEEKTCNMHTKEKEKSGTCCRVNEDQENAEALTYEHSLKSLSIHELAQTNPTKTYRELEQIKSEQNPLETLKIPLQA